MANKRRARAWWVATLQRWRRSGLTAEQFAVHEGLAVGTLRWWSSQLGRDTRASHGSSGGKPIEIVLPQRVDAATTSAVEIVRGDVVVRCATGVDPAYVAALVRALGEG